MNLLEPLHILRLSLLIGLILELDVELGVELGTVGAPELHHGNKAGGYNARVGHTQAMLPHHMSSTVFESFGCFQDTLSQIRRH